jgi:hypothetical protein
VLEVATRLVTDSQIVFTLPIPLFTKSDDVIKCNVDGKDTLCRYKELIELHELSFDADCPQFVGGLCPDSYSFVVTVTGFSNRYSTTMLPISAGHVNFSTLDQHGNYIDQGS